MLINYLKGLGLKAMPYYSFLVLMFGWGFVRHDFFGWGIWDGVTWLVNILLIACFVLGRMSVRRGENDG